MSAQQSPTNLQTSIDRDKVNINNAYIYFWISYFINFFQGISMDYGIIKSRQ